MSPRAGHPALEVELRDGPAASPWSGWAVDRSPASTPALAQGQGRISCHEGRADLQPALRTDPDADRFVTGAPGAERPTTTAPASGTERRSSATSRSWSGTSSAAARRGARHGRGSPPVRRVHRAWVSCSSSASHRRRRHRRRAGGDPAGPAPADQVRPAGRGADRGRRGRGRPDRPGRGRLRPRHHLQRRAGRGRDAHHRRRPAAVRVRHRRRPRRTHRLGRRSRAGQDDDAS